MPTCWCAPSGPVKEHVAPGHEIVEMGLVRLYRITGKKDYLDLAKFFIDQRGIKKYNTKAKTNTKTATISRMMSR